MEKEWFYLEKLRIIVEYGVCCNGKWEEGERWDMKCRNTCQYFSTMILSIQTLQDILVSLSVYNWWRFVFVILELFQIGNCINHLETAWRTCVILGYCKSHNFLNQDALKWLISLAVILVLLSLNNADI